MHLLSGITQVSFVILSLFAPGFSATENVVIQALPVEYQFGKSLTFQARITSTEKPLSVHLSITNSATQTNTLIPVDFADEDVYHTTVPVDDIALQPFDTLNYQFIVSTPADETVTSPSYTFRYIDNRYTWASLEINNYHIHWYDGDKNLAMRIVKAASKAYNSAKAVISKPDNKPIHLYIYDDRNAMQSAIGKSQAEWIAGLAYPKSRILLAALTPGANSTEEIDRIIPHELMHIWLYALVGESYESMPVWLNEGLSSYVETSRNPEYKAALQTANRGDTLIPISDLCQSFPKNSSDFILAYAESESFVNYLVNQYGVSMLQRLLGAYKANANCEASFYEVYRLTLPQADRNWQTYLFDNDINLSNLFRRSPWVSVFILVFLTPVVLSIFSLFEKRRRKNHG